MLLSVISNWQVMSDQPVISIPLGTEFQLKATFHDNVGNIFTTSTTVLKIRSSRMDLVRIKPGTDNSSLIVSTKKPGLTVLKVWADEIQKTADYVKLNVQQSALPAVVSFLFLECCWSPAGIYTLSLVSRALQYTLGSKPPVADINVYLFFCN